MNEPHVYAVDEGGGSFARMYRADDPAIVRALAIAAVVDSIALVAPHLEKGQTAQWIISEAETDIAKQTTEGER